MVKAALGYPRVLYVDKLRMYSPSFLTVRFHLQKFGTPLEDALRRDITINTLFYNIHTREVEDWTQKVRGRLHVPSH